MSDAKIEEAKAALRAAAHKRRAAFHPVDAPRRLGPPRRISSRQCRLPSRRGRRRLLADPRRARLQADPGAADGYRPASLPAGGARRRAAARAALWEQGAPLYEAGFGTLAPAETAPRAEPDVIIMPLLGFDRHGTRLGYGGGYYDRTLAALTKRPRLIGFAFAPQELDAIPREAHDVPLDAIVTEARCSPFRQRRLLRESFCFWATWSAASGRDAVAERLPGSSTRYSFDFVVINGENASHGRGLTEPHFAELKAAGADVVTLGDHAFDQRDTLTYIEREPTLLRPINLPPGTPGRGANLVESRNGHRVLVINAQGRVFMDPIDDPFRAVEAAVAACPLGEQADAIIVDFHTEATSEIQAHGLLPRWQGQPRRRHPHPYPDRRPPHPQGRHGADGRCRHVRRLRLDHRGRRRRAAQPLPHRHCQWPLHARPRARRRCAASPSRPIRGPVWRRKVLPVRIGGTLAQAEPAF